ncbi:MAG: PQQ-binding-like beta-propeller repeat protein [bacterium]|nr:PQQ-binding-like beta-propeller repeat protein [bacterium]
MKTRLLFLFPIALFTTAPAWCDWPLFRGPNNDGVVPPQESGEPRGLPLEWSESDNVVWKTAIHDKGWSTPVVWGDQVWLTTASEDGRHLYAICVNANDGAVLFDKEIFTIESPDPLGNDVNTYASCGSAIEDGRVYVHFGSYGTAAIDTKTFETIWVRRDLPCNHFRGPASSVVLFEDLVILTFDGADFDYQAALYKDDGCTAWITGRTTIWKDYDVDGLPKREGDFRKSFSTPLIVDVNGEPRMLISATYGAFCYDPRDGREVWKIDHEGYSNASMAMYGGGLAYLFSGRGKSTLFAIKPDGSGDVTDSKVVWTYDRGLPSMVSGLLVDRRIYMINNGGVATCLNAENGEPYWRERVEGQYYASPVYADGRIYFFSMDGTTTVVKPGDEYEILATSKLDDGFMASPAVSGKAFFLRTTANLYRIEAK